jgi:putative N-acetylmannosamine-6-phosphate epimerase/predicted NBD/HSP70 family sugar kinase
VKFKTLLARLGRCPLIASVQASPKSPVDNPETLLRLARASVQEGVELLRLEGLKNIRSIKPDVPVPVIGLIKRNYPGSDVYITPAAQDVDTLLDLGCEIIALDGTQRSRPFEHRLPDLIDRIHRREAIAMADCDSLDSAIAAEAAGADLVGTTLAGYTAEHPATKGPDLDLLRQICNTVKVPVIAEGRYSQRWEVEAALRIGAVAVVIGGALNDPVKQTRALKPVSPNRDPNSVVGAIDIGGTWLRFARFSGDWKLIDVERTPNPPKREDRIAWIRSKVEEHGIQRLGLGTGGVTDPHTGEVWTAKEYLMPDHVGIVFSEETLGVTTFAHGDGHASAWGHANLPRYAGRKVATLAIGTGVGCGFVADGKIWAGTRGEYPRVNDLTAPGGGTFEDLLGGIHLTAEPSDEQKQKARTALIGAVDVLRGMYFPDDLVVCGSVGMSDWLAPELERLGLDRSPFGHDAGIYGAAALALFPDYM